MKIVQGTPYNSFAVMLLMANIIYSLNNVADYMSIAIEVFAIGVLIHNIKSNKVALASLPNEYDQPIWFLEYNDIVGDWYYNKQIETLNTWGYQVVYLNPMDYRTLCQFTYDFEQDYTLLNCREENIAHQNPSIETVKQEFQEFLGRRR